MGKTCFGHSPSSSLSKVVRGTLGGLPASLTVGSGHERALAPLLVLLLVGTVGGTFAGVLVPLRLALEDASAKGLRSWQARARASVLSTVVASVMMWVVAKASPFPCITTGTPVSIEDVACIAVEAKTLMHRNRGVWPTTLLCLVDRHVLIGLF